MKRSYKNFGQQAIIRMASFRSFVINAMDKTKSHALFV